MKLTLLRVSFVLAACFSVLKVGTVVEGAEHVQLFSKSNNLTTSQKINEPLSKVRNGYSTATNCPEKCVCFMNEGFVNCSRLGFTSIPALPINVTQLDVSENSIIHLQDNVFSSYPNLQYVDFSGNHLNDRSFTNKTFSGTQKLTKLDFGFNAFTSLPSHLPQEIETLWFYYCKIHQIDSFTTPYGNLSYLDLSQNRLQSIPNNLSQFFPNLNHIDVSFNQISTVENSTFEKTIHLEFISLRFNKLTMVPGNFPSSLLNLDLVGNPITEIKSNTFAYLTKLETLSMWESALTTIHDFAFNGLGHVTILDFMECHVTSPITNNTFHGLIEVQSIDLSLSNISRMEPGALLGLNKLQELWLNDNPFKTLDPLLFDRNTIPSISEIYLWGNNWVCDCKLRWLKKMQEANSVIQDPHLMVCAEPESLKGKTWENLHSSQFLC